MNVKVLVFKILLLLSSRNFCKSCTDNKKIFIYIRAFPLVTKLNLECMDKTSNTEWRPESN